MDGWVGCMDDICMIYVYMYVCMYVDGWMYG